MASCACDGVLMPCPSSPGELLARLPRGAYTTGRTRGRSLFVAWPLHRRRLLASLRLLLVGEVDESALVARLAATLRVAVGAAPPPFDAPLLLVLHVSADAALACTVHAAPLPRGQWAEPRSPGPAADAAALGPPRPPPYAAKCSEWAAQRGPQVAAARAAGCAEALLAHPGGWLTEGALTSLFVVDASGVLRTAAVAHGALPGLGRAAVVAALLNGGAQRGRGGVEDDCGGGDDNDESDWKPPRRADAPGWREAFLVSAVRGVTPLRSVMWLGGEGGGEGDGACGEGGVTCLPGGGDPPGPFAAAAAAAVAAWAEAAGAPDVARAGWAGGDGDGGDERGGGVG